MPHRIYRIRIYSRPDASPKDSSWQASAGHHNAVDVGIVEKVAEYIYSSASDYYGKQGGKILFSKILPVIRSSYFFSFAARHCWQSIRGWKIGVITKL